MENLDDFIKAKLEQTPIEFNEAHWLQAARMIDRQEEKKRRRFLLATFFVQLCALTITAFVIGMPISQEERPTVPVSREATSSPIVTTSILPDSKKEKIDENNPDPIANGLKQAVDTEQPTVSDPYHKPPVNGHKTPGKTTSVAGMSSSGSWPGKQQLDRFAPQVTKTQQASTAGEASGNSDLPKTITLAARQLNELDLLNSKLNLLEQQAENITISPQLYDEKRPFRSSISLYVASTLYPYTQVTAQPLIAYTAGINYSLNLKKAWSLDAGLHYRVRAGRFANTQTTRQDSFAFGRISSEYYLRAEQLHTLELPLALSYSSHRHQFLLGVNYVRLLGLRGSLRKTDNPENPSVAAAVVKEGWLEDSSFKTNRFDAFAGYYFTVRPGLRIGAKVHYVLGGFQSENTDLYLESKPIFIDFGLRYNLINR